ncbi:MAG: hypothetical protein KatS3mg124_2270 [Porticoccaceae bacterium]|nr:MAG: hypothetical protein KatS3mg124_2270 [Porticoccaceae bacterium]
MELRGEQRVPASRDRVWEALNDPQVLQSSIPGCQSLSRESPERFSALVEVKVGPIAARFRGVVTLADLDPPNAYTLILEGNGGITGTVRGKARVQLREEGGETVVAYTVEAEVGGRLAQLGGAVIEATARQLADAFFRRFAEVVAGERPVAAPAAAPAARAPAVPAAAPRRWAAAAALLLAAVAGFALGRASGAGDDWAGVAFALLVLLVAAVAYDWGRRSAEPRLVLDAEALRRLLERSSP